MGSSQGDMWRFREQRRTQKKEQKKKEAVGVRSSCGRYPLSYQTHHALVSKRALRNAQCSMCKAAQTLMQSLGLRMYSYVQRNGSAGCRCSTSSRGNVAHMSVKSCWVTLSAMAKQ